MKEHRYVRIDKRTAEACVALRKAGYDIPQVVRRLVTEFAENQGLISHER